MGHNRIGRLPRTRRWARVVGLLNEPSLDASAVARASALAAEKRLRGLSNDPTLVHCFWILTRLASAARQPDFASALAEIGVQARPNEPILGFIARISEQVRNEVVAHPESGHFATLASLLHTTMSRGPLSQQLQEFLGIGITATVRHGLNIAATSGEPRDLALTLAINAGAALLLVIGLWLARQYLPNNSRETASRKTAPRTVHPDRMH